MFKERIKTHHSAMAEGKRYVKGMRKLSEHLAVAQDGIENSVVYIHVPFCTKICTFCNMRRSLQAPSNNYADLLVAEIKEYAALPYVRKSRYDAVYFGGGTPTTLTTKDLVKILRTLKQELSFTEDVEITVETTVTQLTEEKWRALIDAGVNRFSVGVQTFDDVGRKKMGRIGSGEAAYERLQQLKEAGVTVSMDLIYNYPEQTMESLYEDLEKIISLELDGFSMYSLIDMKETLIDQAQSQHNDEEMFFAISSHMQQAGYQFLELTKMVKTDSYKYIMNRHAAADTLPLGAGAGGSINGVAMMNPIQLQEYEASVQNFDKRQGMYFASEYKEVVCFKGAIQTTYLPENTWLYRSQEEFEKVRDNLLKYGMIESDGSRDRLTTKGVFWGNTISRELSSLIV